MARKATTTKNASQNIQQTFSFTAPQAMSVLLAGDFTLWQEKAIPMKKETGGVWKATVALPRGTHEYRFIVDGQWHNDPACTLQVPNTYGGKNSARQVA